MVLLLAFTHYPAVATFWHALFTTPRGARPARFVGLENYQALIADPVFWQAFTNNLIYAAATIPLSVGLALATDLLPFPDDTARDLGFVNVAAALGQLLGPLIGAGLVALVGGFWLLFAVGGALSILGGLMVLPIRGGRTSPL